MNACTIEEIIKQKYLKFKRHILRNTKATQLIISKYMPFTPYPI
jgi:hypothetical protein